LDCGIASNEQVATLVFVVELLQQQATVSNYSLQLTVFRMAFSPSLEIFIVGPNSDSTTKNNNSLHNNNNNNDVPTDNKMRQMKITGEISSAC